MKRLALFLVLTGSIFAVWDTGEHDDGLLWMRITNYGTLGYENAAIWPKGSGESYIFGAGIWIGALERIAEDTTVLSEAVDDTSTVIPVASTDPFASIGVLRIGDELIHYSEKTDSSFTGCIRGFAG